MDDTKQLEAPLARSPDASARVAGCGRTTIFGAIKSGNLRARKLGRKTLVLDQDLQSWLGSLPEKGAPETNNRRSGANRLSEQEASAHAAR